MSAVLLVTGSRALADTPEATRWAMGLLTKAVHELPGGGSVGPFLFHGGAAGPDSWAGAIARKAGGVIVVEYLLDGFMWRHGRRAERWPDPGGREPLPLRRNRAMVLDAVHWEFRYPVRVLALVAPWSATHGTDHTVRRAELSGLGVARHECPREFAPTPRAGRRSR